MSTPIGLIALGVGVVLMFSSYRNVSPIALVENALTGGTAKPADLPKLGAGSATLAPGATPSTPAPNDRPPADVNDTPGNIAWIKSHLGQWPHPGKGATDFWNGYAAAAARAANVSMVGQP